MYTIILNNQGGALDTKTAETPEQAAQMAIDMILNCGVLYSGDSITIQGEEGDE